jgi:serine phosphatase RsbU (regulator of sigma subunit)
MVKILRREAAKGRTAAQVVERFFEELDAFTGGALQIDDETAVVVRRVR